jgi:RHS repeat-associated protein
VLDFTDRHTDLDGQFTAAGTALAGSRTFGPWGAVTAAGGTVTGTLGYQSQYTSPATGQVDMGARWYNPGTGSFGNKDTVSNKPVPDSASASPFGYAADNPLDLTDPSGRTALDAHQLHLLHVAHVAAVAHAAHVAHVEHVEHVAYVAYQAQAAKYAAQAQQWTTTASNYPSYNWGQGPEVVPAAPVSNPFAGSRWSGNDLGPSPESQAAAAAATRAPVRKPAAGSAPASPVGICGLAGLKQGLCGPGGMNKAVGHASGTGGDFLAGLGSTVASLADLSYMQVPLGCDLGRAAGVLPSQQYQKQVNDRFHINTGSEEYKGGVALGVVGTSLIGGEADEDSILSLLGRGCGGKSFSAGTRVLLATGKAVPIAALKVGDRVLASDTRTGKDQPETVTAVLVHHDTDLYNLTVKTAGGTAVIHTTAAHLLWDPYLKQWRPAAKLTKGEHLKSPGGSTATVVGGTTPKVHDGWMWDLTVPGNNDHDFYVLPARPEGSGARGSYNQMAGAAPVLVHNDSCEPNEIPPLRQQYVQEVNGLKKLGETLQNYGASDEVTARTLHAMRRIIGVEYKGLTPPDLLDEIYARNLDKYGDPLGPTIPYLLERGRSWQDIIESASRTGGRDLGF